MKPSKCEKHQNYKYMNFCPFCKVLDDRDALQKTCDALRAEVEQLKYDLKITEGQRDNESGVLELVAEERDNYRKALLAVKQDALKCEQSDPPTQYVITQWAIDKIDAALE